MSEWQRTTLSLRDDHQWRTPPGYRIFVMDRGAVRFNFPHSWLVEPDADSVKLYDLPEPETSCVLGVSYHYLPPATEAAPLEPLLRELLQRDERGAAWNSTMQRGNRAACRWVWAESALAMDTEMACSRLCLAQNASVRALLTLDFLAARREEASRAWAALLHSLELGTFIVDPTYGTVVRSTRPSFFPSS